LNGEKKKFHSFNELCQAIGRLDHHHDDINEKKNENNNTTVVVGDTSSHEGNQEKEKEIFNIQYVNHETHSEKDTHVETDHTFLTNTNVETVSTDIHTSSSSTATATSHTRRDTGFVSAILSSSGSTVEGGKSMKPTLSAMEENEEEYEDDDFQS
jgi:hypothetical protein